MASPLLFRAPQCLSCIRRIAGSLGDAYHFPASQQVRGKKKIAKVATVNVELLHNMPGYGMKGSVTSVITGRMRNIWYPNKVARYITEERLQELKLKRNVVAERDFGMKSRRQRMEEAEAARIEKAEKKKHQDEADEAAADARRIEEAKANDYQYLEIRPQESKASIALQVLSPSEATKTLEEIAPLFLEFYKFPVTVPQRTASTKNVPLGEEAAGREQEPQRVAIYGSVTANDVADNLRTVLRKDPRGARVVFSAANITFVDDLPDGGRVKHMGVFEFDILLDGATQPVRRAIEVKEQL